MIGMILILIIEDACGESPPRHRAHKQRVEWTVSGPARAAARPLSFAEASVNEVEFYSTRHALVARRRSLRFAEAAALPGVQNMRGASIIILSLMLSFIRFRRVGGSAGELKIDSERVQKTGKQRFGRRE